MASKGAKPGVVARPVIHFCTCIHAFQDRRYGKQNRVHNRGKKGASAGTFKYSCTVCGREIIK